MSMKKWGLRSRPKSWLITGTTNSSERHFEPFPPLTTIISYLSTVNPFSTDDYIGGESGFPFVSRDSARTRLSGPSGASLPYHDLSSFALAPRRSS